MYTPVSNILQAKGSSLPLLQPGGGQSGTGGAVGRSHCTPWTLGHTGLVCPNLAPQGMLNLCPKNQEVRGLN